MENRHKVYIVSDSEGYGWSPSFGKKVTPDIFPALDLAMDYITEVNVKFPEVGLKISPWNANELIKW